MNLSLAFSPCPNDCFMFDALVHGKIDTKGFIFKENLLDIDQLNSSLKDSRYDVCKASIYALLNQSEAYTICDAGAALGFGCGPLLICKNLNALRQKPIQDWHVAIPGIETTAHLLLKRYFPEIHYKTVFRFSAIEDAVLHGTVDAGLIIHENRFTYADKGLECVTDLGQKWEEEMHLPIPLGGIGLQKKLNQNIKEHITQCIKKSIAYALQYPHDSLSYVLEHAQHMSPEVVTKHINLYVNAFSLSIGEKGQNAIIQLQRS
jgi:1,4-dihydroxy-6-naphthoate synthase